MGCSMCRVTMPATVRTASPTAHPDFMGFARDRAPRVTRIAPHVSSSYTPRMSVMVSFRADEDEVAAADRWAEVLGVERSELLREALAGHLARLAAEEEAAAYE